MASSPRAVYRTEVDKLAAAVRTLAGTMTPTEAFRAWMLLFIDYIATKKIIAPALKSPGGGAPTAVEESYAAIHATVSTRVRRAVEAGEMRPDIEPVDLLRALVGVAYLEASADWRQSATRLVDI